LEDSSYNGKFVNKFIQEDLGSIHALIEDTLKSNKNTDIKAINNLMKEQLENLLSQFNVNKGSPCSSFILCRGMLISSSNSPVASFQMCSIKSTTGGDN
jgi:hypothetical protein